MSLLIGCDASLVALFSAQASRSVKVHGGIPFILSCGAGRLNRDARVAFLNELVSRGKISFPHA